MSEPDKKGMDHIEFETKYAVDDEKLIEFKKIVDSIQDEKSFTYVEGPDTYFTHKDMPNSFGRYRKPSYGLDNGRSEVTFKIKPEDAKNNIMRKEFNWRVDKTPEETIFAGFDALGFEFNFSIWKSCHILNLSDATLVFYTVYETTDGVRSKKPQSFLEIEVNEERIKGMSEEDAWKVIEKYEKLLEPVGINAYKRMKRSLFEMFVKKVGDNDSKKG